MKHILIAFLETVRKTLENLTFAGAIAILLDGEFTFFKVGITFTLFLLTILVRVIILKKKKKVEKSTENKEGGE